MTATAEIEIDQKSHLKMWRLMSRRSMKTCYVAGILGIAMVLIFAIPAGASAAEVVSIILAGLLAMAFIVWISFLMLPRRSRKLYSQTASLGEKQIYELDESGFSVTQDSGSTRSKWKDLYMWDEDQDVFLMQPNSMQAFLIPKAQVDPTFIDYAKSKLAETGLIKQAKPRK